MKKKIKMNKQEKKKKHKLFKKKKKIKDVRFNNRVRI